MDYIEEKKEFITLEGMQVDDLQNASQVLNEIVSFMEELNASSIRTTEWISIEELSKLTDTLYALARLKIEIKCDD